MKSFNLKKVLGIVALVAVVLVAGLLFTRDSELTDEEIGTPPGVMIDSSFNATLSGSPYYFVTRSDERLYDDSLDTCTTKGSNTDRLQNQNGWYRVVAHEDNLTVREIVFSQVELREDDPTVIFYYNAEDQTFEAQPNRILRNSDGSRLPELDLDKKLDKGEVVVVTSNRSADFCADYDEASPHVNVYEGWNLIAKPDFEKVDFRSIWEVALAKGGNSGTLPEKYFPTTNANFDAANLTDNDLYWVYVGAGGVIDPGGEPADDQEIVLEHNGQEISNGDTFEISEKDGVFQYTLGLKENAAEKVELEFELLENGQVVANFANAEEVTSTAVGATSVVTGISFAKGEKDPANLVLTAIDDSDNGDDEVELRIKDKAGKLDARNFKLTLKDDDAATENTLNVLVVESAATEQATQTPIDDANVAIKNTTVAGKTGADGKVELKTTLDTLEIEVSADGFDDKTVTVDDFSNEVVVVLQKSQPTEGAALEVKATPIDKDEYIVVGPVDGSLIKSFDLNKFTINKLENRNGGTVATPVAQGAALEGVLEGGDDANGHPTLKIKLASDKWDEGANYRLDFSRNGVAYVDNSFNPASTGLFSTNADVVGAALEVKNTLLNSDEYVQIGAVDASKVKTEDFSKIKLAIVKKDNNGNETFEDVNVALSKLAPVSAGGTFTGFDTFSFKLSSGNWEFDTEYRVQLEKGAVTYMDDSVSAESEDRFIVNPDFSAIQACSGNINILVTGFDSGSTSSLQTNVANSFGSPWVTESGLDFDQAIARRIELKAEGVNTILECGPTEKTLNLVVRDASNDDPLVGASVVIVGTTFEVTTDPNGKASITTSEDSIQVEVSFSGYDTKTVTVTDFSSELVVELSNIVISCNSTPINDDYTWIDSNGDVSDNVFNVIDGFLSDFVVIGKFSLKDCPYTLELQEDTNVFNPVQNQRLYNLLSPFILIEDRSGNIVDNSEVGWSMYVDGSGDVYLIATDLLTAVIDFSDLVRVNIGDGVFWKNNGVDDLNGRSFNR